MLTSIPNTPTKGLGLSAFSAANKTIFEQNVKEALKKGFEATFMFDVGDDGKEMAQMFADVCGPALTNAIDSYIQAAIKSQMIMITPVTLMSPVGPCTGVMTSATDIQIN